MRTYVLNLLHPSGSTVAAQLAAADFDEIRAKYQKARETRQPCLVMSQTGSVNLGELIDLAAFDAIDIVEIREASPAT